MHQSRLDAGPAIHPAVRIEGVWRAPRPASTGRISRTEGICGTPLEAGELRSGCPESPWNFRKPPGTIVGVDCQREPFAAVEFGHFKVAPHRRELVVDDTPIALGGRDCPGSYDSLLRPSMRHGCNDNRSAEANLLDEGIGRSRGVQCAANNARDKAAVAEISGRPIPKYYRRRRVVRSILSENHEPRRNESQPSA
jgi:hypothetical protein